MIGEKKLVARIQDYKRTFSTQHGERVLLDLMEHCNMLRPTFNQKNEVNLSIYNEGMRGAALYILSKN